MTIHYCHKSPTTMTSHNTAFNAQLSFAYPAQWTLTVSGTFVESFCIPMQPKSLHNRKIINCTKCLQMQNALRVGLSEMRNETLINIAVRWEISGRLFRINLRKLVLWRRLEARCDFHLNISKALDLWGEISLFSTKSRESRLRASSECGEFNCELVLKCPQRIWLRERFLLRRLLNRSLSGFLTVNASPFCAVSIGIA